MQPLHFIITDRRLELPFLDKLLISLISPATFSPDYSFICSVCPSIIFFKLCKSKMTNIYTHVILLVLRHLMVVNRAGLEPA